MLTCHLSSQSITEGDEAAGEGAAAGGDGQAPGALFTVLDIAWIQSLASMPRKHWSEIHIRGTDAPFVVGGGSCPWACVACGAGWRRAPEGAVAPCVPLAGPRGLPPA